MSSGTPGKRRGNLPKESKEKLKQWLSMHVEHPYPTEEEKKDLAAEAGMTMGQVSLQIYDFANHITRTDQQLVHKRKEKNSPKNSSKVGISSIFLPHPSSTTW
jgi:hypothetical protein